MSGNVKGTDFYETLLAGVEELVRMTNPFLCDTGGSLSGRELLAKIYLGGDSCCFKVPGVYRAQDLIRVIETEKRFDPLPNDHATGEIKLVPQYPPAVEAQFEVRYEVRRTAKGSYVGEFHNNGEAETSSSGVSRASA